MVICIGVGCGSSSADLQERICSGIIVDSGIAVTTTFKQILVLRNRIERFRHFDREHISLRTVRKFEALPGSSLDYRRAAIQHRSRAIAEQAFDRPLTRQYRSVAVLRTISHILVNACGHRNTERFTFCSNRIDSQRIDGRHKDRVDNRLVSRADLPCRRRKDIGRILDFVAVFILSAFVCRIPQAVVHDIDLVDIALTGFLFGCRDKNHMSRVDLRFPDTDLFTINNAAVPSTRRDCKCLIDRGISPVHVNRVRHILVAELTDKFNIDFIGLTIASRVRNHGILNRHRTNRFDNRYRSASCKLVGAHIIDLEILRHFSQESRLENISASIAFNHIQPALAVVIRRHRNHLDSRLRNFRRTVVHDKRPLRLGLQVHRFRE